MDLNMDVVVAPCVDLRNKGACGDELRKYTLKPCAAFH